MNGLPIIETHHYRRVAPEGGENGSAISERRRLSPCEYDALHGFRLLAK